MYKAAYEDYSLYARCNPYVVLVASSALLVKNGVLRWLNVTFIWAGRMERTLGRRTGVRPNCLLLGHWADNKREAADILYS